MFNNFTYEPSAEDGATEIPATALRGLAPEVEAPAGRDLRRASSFAFQGRLRAAVFAAAIVRTVQRAPPGPLPQRAPALAATQPPG